jgi:glycosyltransferase involved in cell wall biosynthesis
MRIGIFTEFFPYLPARDGFRVYEANLLRELSQRHELHLVSLFRDDDAPNRSWAESIFKSISLVNAHSNSVAQRLANSISIYGTGKALHYRDETVQLLTSKASNEKWDLLYVAGNFIAGLVPDSLSLPKVLSLHDAHTLRFRQKAKSATSFKDKFTFRALERLQARYERIQFNKYDACTFVSQKDLDEQRRLGVNVEMKVIPLAVDTEYFKPSGNPQKRNLVFHGNLSYEPNVEAVLEFTHFILPELLKSNPELEFCVVGSNPSQSIKDLATADKLKLVASPADLRPFIDDAAVYVCAMRLGTGMKTKLLEAMAMEKPIVAYPEAVDGIEGAEESNISIAQDHQDFISRAQSLLDSPERRISMGREARSLVLKRYSWNSRASELESLLLECKARSARS